MIISYAVKNYVKNNDNIRYGSAIIMVLISMLFIKSFTFKILKDRENNDQKRLKNTILKHIITNLVLLF